MKKVIFTILALCVMCVCLQAQTPTTNAKGVTSTGKLDTVLNKRVQAQSDEPGPQPQVQRNFVSPIGEKGLRPQISRTGERLSVDVTITYDANAISNVTYSSAKFTATLSESGNYVMPILERGVCFGVTENPTIDVDSKSESEIQGTEVGTGTFTASLENLTPGTTYHLRGYAVIVDDTIYSEDLTFPFSPTFSCGQDKMVDADGNKYETVQLGDQCWTKTNMRVASGTNKSGTQDWSTTEPYYYVRPNVNDSIWGYYYNFPATMQVCPEGWHVPSKAEWDTMVFYVGTYKENNVYKYRCPFDNALAYGETYIARALADSNGWKNTVELEPCMIGYNTAENNATGFSAYPAGFWDGSFQYEFEAARFWSNDRRCYYRQYNDSVIGRDMDNDCFSVRCVRNFRLNLSSSADNNRALMCGDVTVNYLATLTEGDPDSCKWFISYPENSSSFSTSQAGNAFSVTYHNTGNYIVNCVAYKSGKAVVNSIATQVVSNKPFFTYSRNGLSVTIDSIGEGCTIDWGCTTGTLSNNGRTYTYPSTDTYTITVTNQDNCAFTAVIAGLACKGIGSSNANETATGVAGNYTITAVRDHENNEYHVVQIGSQCWLAENLRTTTSPSTHSYLVQQNEPMSYSRKVACWLNDDSTTYAPKHYGLLYNWCAAVDTFNAESDVYEFDNNDAPWVPVLNLNAAGHRRGICPAGWHIPTEDEWNTLITAAGASCDYEGTGSARLTTGTDWKKGYVIQNSYNSMPGNLKYEGRNASGFSALPAAAYDDMNKKAMFWSTTQNDINSMFSHYPISVPSLMYFEAGVSWESDVSKLYLASVRCLRDPNILDLSTVTTDTTVQHGWTVTGTLGANVKISIADGATVTLHGVNINGNGTWNTGDYAGITCLGDATLILEDSSTVKGFDGYYPGIYVFGDADHPSHDKTLTIMGAGTLNSSSNGHAAGIGGGWNIHCGNIVITGGKVIATGGSGAAAIGGGDNSRCGNITIGGTAVVFATSESRGAGIGGGYLGVCGNITISGTAVVSATGGGYGAGIGAGGGYLDSSCGNILIEGGTVEATGGSQAAGIGCGGNSSSSSTCGTITITTGVTRVKATKGVLSPFCIGIGDGNCSCDTITIGGVNKGSPGVGDSDNYIYEPTH